MESLKSQSVTQITTEAKSWLQRHERLLIVAIVVLASYFVLNKSLNIVSTYESHKATQAAAVTAAQAAKNAEALTQAQQTLQSYQQQLVLFAQANQKLTAAIATRDSQLSTQQTADKTLPPSSLADRWTSLINDKGVATSDNGFTVTPSAAVSTVIQLESVPVLQQDITDEKVKETNLQADVTKANELIGQGKNLVSGLQLQLTDQAKECKIELSAEKAKARKGILKSFGIGYAAGFISGLLVKVTGL